MLRSFSRLLLIAILCLSIGGHWMALQAVAWTTMLVTNTQKTSLREAFMRTFDGEHPCKMCRAINAAQDSQKKPAAQLLPSKPDLFYAGRPLPVTRAFQNIYYPRNVTRVITRGHSPPVPPPRALLS